jgi:hypothetical protein
MDIGQLWYLIERDKLHRVVSAEEFQQLSADSFVLHQVFERRHEALLEMARLIQADIQAVSLQVEERDARRSQSL